MAKVSIIIPTYNVEEYLVECMESVVRQTLKDVEIICINDGSTDGSLEILQSYAQKDERIVIVDKENGGYGMAMNIGIERATGEYIGIVEPDDFVPLSMYEDLYEIASKNQLDFVKADFYRFVREAETGNMELTYFHLSQKPEDYNTVFDPSQTPEAVRYIMNTWSGIYRREFLLENQIRHHETPGASFQDNGFYFQTFIYGKRAMIVDRPYYMNRRDNPNSSVHNREKVYCMNQEYDYIREILLQDKEIWNRFKYVYWMKKASNYLATVRRIGDEYKREYLLRFSEEFRRAKECNELRRSVFTEPMWQEVQYIMNDPEGYWHRRCDQAGVLQLEKDSRELKKVKESTTYQVGRMVMYLPIKIKKMLKGK